MESVGKTNTRNNLYDSVRGLAIILVVIGHAIQSAYVDCDSVKIFELIYSFHMPLFMFLSGFVSYKDNRPIDNTWLKQRFQKLVIPFVVWIFIPYVCSLKWNVQDIMQEIIEIIKSPDKSNWFLWILFLNDCVLWLGYKIKGKTKCKNVSEILIALVIAIYIIFILIRSSYFGLALLPGYSMYFCTGYIVAKNKDRVRKKFINVLEIGFGTVFIFIGPMYSRIDDPMWIKLFIEKGYSVLLCKLLSYGFRYVVAFCGIAFVFLTVSILLYKFERIPLLEYLGTKSIEIYLLHRYWFGIMKMQDIHVQIVLNVITGIFVSLFIAYIIEEGLLSRILFGKSKN